MNEDRQPLSGTATDAAAASNCVVSESWVDRVAIVSASGTVDMLSAPQLEQSIRDVLAKGPAGLVVDFTAVDFLASAGMGVLVATHDEVSPTIGFCVVAKGPATSRPLKLVGIADIVPLYATIDEAMHAIGGNKPDETGTREVP